MKPKKYLERVPVGFEWAGECLPQCPQCLRPEGEKHAYGCANEQCPGCGQILVGCRCNCLSPVDTAKIIKTLHDQFATPMDAVEVVMAAGVETGQAVSYLIHAAMQYLYENVPPEIRADLNRGFQKSHPELIPLLQDEFGHGYYTAEQLSTALQIPLAEVHEKIEAMVEAGQGIRFGDGIRLQKVN